MQLYLPALVLGVQVAVLFTILGCRACTMNVGKTMFCSSAVNSCPGSPALVLAVQVALLYTVIAGRADCRARVQTATRKSYRLVERLTKKKSLPRHFAIASENRIRKSHPEIPTRGLTQWNARIQLNSINEIRFRRIRENLRFYPTIMENDISFSLF